MIEHACFYWRRRLGKGLHTNTHTWENFRVAISLHHCNEAVNGHKNLRKVRALAVWLRFLYCWPLTWNKQGVRCCARVRRVITASGDANTIIRHAQGPIVHDLTHPHTLTLTPSLARPSLPLNPWLDSPSINLLLGLRLLPPLSPWATLFSLPLYPWPTYLTFLLAHWPAFFSFSISLSS